MQNHLSLFTTFKQLNDHYYQKWHTWTFPESKGCVVGRVGSEYFQSTRVRVLSTAEVLEDEYEYFSPFYKSTRVRVQSTQNVLMNTLMSTFRW